MSLARDDAGNIRELHTKASGLSHNFRDASGGSGGSQRWRHSPTPIQTPGKSMKGLASNPYNRLKSGGARQIESKAGSSSAPKSSLRQPPKRRKLDHLQENSVSKYFSKELPQQRQGPQAIPSTSTSSHHNRPTSNAIIIDAEDDTPATNEPPRETTVLRISSPDPMDVIGPEASYDFDQNKPSPIQLFSSSFEETRKPSQDGQSTLRVRNVMKELETRTAMSVSRLVSDADDARSTNALPTSLSRDESSAQAKASSRRGNVKEKVALIEQGKRDNHPPHLNLRTIVPRSRKEAMKPKQPRRDIPALPIQHLDPDATRPSGFISTPKLPKGKATATSVSVHLPLKEWAIGAAILSSQEVTPELLTQLIWEAGVLKVRDANGSIPFELQVEKGSIDGVKYVDIKRTTALEPLVQIHPSVMVNVQNRTTFTFKPGSNDPEGLLTFKFDTSASGWDNEVYIGVIQRLLESLTFKNGKSILDGPAARAVWEAVTRVSEDTSMIIEPEPMILDIPKENPPNPPSKPRPRLKPRGNTAATADIFVRRSTRLSGSGVEEKRFSPRPDPDEVILGYRSGTGSLNITNGDVGRLNPGEFLNDTLIEFGLKLWLADLQESNPELASQVHVFSSFFYKKLSTKIPEEGYNSVKKWTSKFDLFQKKYIIVPINENLHWYLAIIYCPEYTLLPSPAQVKNVQPRRSTRRLGVIIDSPDAQRAKPAPRQSLPPQPGPPSNGHVDSVSSSEIVDAGTPRTDDQKSELDVERMVESTFTPVDLPTKRDDGQQQAGTANADILVTRCSDSPLLAYPHSSPTFDLATLSPLDPFQGDDAEAEDTSHVTSAGSKEQSSGIPPSTFYGTKAQGQSSDIIPMTPPRVAPSALSEIEIEEDVTVDNPDSEPEEAAEHPRTYIYTFDSLASKHPQAVKRLSRYLLMEAHDKKQLVEDDLNEPKGMQAIVPHQPNYCDCGIYLLHFARTFMKDPKLSSDIIRSRTSPRKGRAEPHEHWDGASVGSYRDELTARIHSMSDIWKKQRDEQDSGTKNQTDGAAPQEQPRVDPTPTVSSKADNDDSDSDIEVLGSPQKAPPSKTRRRDSGPAESKKKGPAARVR